MEVTDIRPFVFVVMPFRDEFKQIYEDGIKPACLATGARCERVDEQNFNELILERIYEQIEEADLIVSDLTGNSPNVFYETGYAHALNKKVIFVTQDAESIPFDLKHHKNIVYDGQIEKLRYELEKQIRWSIENPLDSHEGIVTHTEYAVSRVKRYELEEFHSFSRSLVGDQIATLERMRDWLEKNPEVLYMIHAHKRLRFRQESRPVGFFSVFPVTKTTKDLLSKNLIKGSEFTAEHIVARGRSPAAVYIGAIGGLGIRGRQQTLLMLMGFITSLTARKTSIVFTRPVSEAGLRLARRYGFEPVLRSSLPPQEMIFCRDFSRR